MGLERSFVVGGAGFIGSHLVERLVSYGPVTIFDNLSVGRPSFVAEPLASGRARLVQGDALDLEQLSAAMAGHDQVFHLAANPEARWGLERTRLDLEQGTIVTYNVLESMRRNGVARLVFSSSGTVYGDTDRVCDESDLGSLPISLYGASKLACEALIAAFVSCFGLRAWIFRFGNVVGPRGTHGAALDFLHKLRAEAVRLGRWPAAAADTNAARDRDARGDSARDESAPAVLEVLGDGQQAKPYLHVTDCVAGMLFGLEHATEPLNIHNLAPPDVTPVSRIAELCIAASQTPNATIRYGGGPRGWPGDVPRSRMSPEQLARLGFRVRHSSNEAVELAVAALAREVFPHDAAG